jgi:uncharacterized membrane protein|tara:strand:+ start:3032 stop:3376 length:345 start_codon:yes stop_codon:yes gene_type:complete
MSWKENEEIWQTIDELITSSYSSVTQLCNLMSTEYGQEMDEVGRGVLFGGLGAMVVGYVAARNEGHDAHDAFGVGMQMVVSNGHFQNLMKEQIAQQVDDKVEQLLPLGGDGEVS